MNKRNLAKVVLAGTLTAALALTGCGAKKEAAPGAGDQAKAPKVKVAMVTDVGGIHDNSFNQSAYEGFKRLETDTGIKVNVTESKKAEDYLPNITSYIKDKIDLTWGIGFLMAEDIKKAAADNPNSKLAIIDSNLDGKIPANVTAVTFKEEEGSFLMGVIAGTMTKSNKIGFVGGMEFPLIQKFEYGFKAGVKAVNPKAEVNAVYAGAFDKPDKGKTLAASLYNSGVDIIYHASGATGDGVFKEAKERGKGFWVIGVDKDQYDLAPTNTLSSMVKRVDNAVYTISKELNDGTWNGGKEVVFGLKDKGVDYAPTTNKNVPADVVSKVDDFKKQIIEGKIVPPATKDKYEAFLAALKK